MKESKKSKPKPPLGAPLDRERHVERSASSTGDRSRDGECLAEHGRRGQ